MYAICYTRIWKETSNHDKDCYFYTVDITKYKTVKNRRKLDYPSILSFIVQFHIAMNCQSPNYLNIPHLMKMKVKQRVIHKTVFLMKMKKKGLHLVSLSELDDFIREFRPTKIKSQICCFSL